MATIPRRISGRLQLLPAPPAPNIERALLRALFMAISGFYMQRQAAQMSKEISAMLLELRAAARDDQADHKAALAQAVEYISALQRISSDPGVAEVLRQARHALMSQHDAVRLSTAMLPKHTAS